MRSATIYYYYFFGGWSGNESRLWLDLVNHRTVKVGGHLPWTNYMVELIRLKSEL